MRHLLDDFRHQSWVMKLFLLWGWLAVVIMISSFATTVTQEICSPSDLAHEQRDQGDDLPVICRVMR